MRLPLLALGVFVLSSACTQAQWQLQDAHTTADLRGIHNLGNGVAWASGTNGTVLRTEDAGFVWQLCAVPPGAEHLDFRGIQAFDNNTAIVMSSGKGDLSRLYKTTDGCQTWTLLATNPDPDGFFDAISASAGSRTSGEKNVLGNVLGDPVNGSFRPWSFGTGPLFDDAPKSHRDRPVLTAWRKKVHARPGEAAFAASNTAMFHGKCGLWIATGGVGGSRVIKRGIRVGPFEYKAEFLEAAEVPLGNKSPSSGTFSLTFRPSSDGPTPRPCEVVGVAVGGDYTAPAAVQNTAATTFDGGRRWLASTTPPHGYRSAVAYDPSHHLWITVGPNGTDISTDDGRNWRPLKPNSAAGDTPDADQHWNALSLPYVVGPHGRIATLRPDALPGPTNAR